MHTIFVAIGPLFTNGMIFLISVTDPTYWCMPKTERIAPALRVEGGVTRYETPPMPAPNGILTSSVLVRVADVAKVFHRYNQEILYGVPYVRNAATSSSLSAGCTPRRSASAALRSASPARLTRTAPP